MYIDKLAEGINPLDDSCVSDEDVVNNVRICRCLHYVSDILHQVIIDEESTGVYMSLSESSEYESEDWKKYISLPNRNVSIDELMEALNQAGETAKRPTVRQETITNWLVHIRALELKADHRGELIEYPSLKGRGLGIITNVRYNGNSRYIVAEYNRSAQQYIIDHLDAIISFGNGKKESRTENRGRVWTPLQDKWLTDLFQHGISIPDIAKALKRTESGIRSRLKRLGLIENRYDV